MWLHAAETHHAPRCTSLRQQWSPVSRSVSTAAALTWVPAAAVGSLALAAGVLSDAGRLNPGAERSPFSWVAAAAALLAAACAARLARGGNAPRRLLLAALLALVAVDEAVGLHERFAADLDARRVAISWPAAALGTEVALLVAAGFLLALEARRPSAFAVAAGVALLGAALAMRFGGGALAALHHLPRGETRRAGEAAAHGLALSGWVLVAGGLLAQAQARARTRTSSAALRER